MAVKHAVAALPEDLRTATILFEYENLSHAEIAAIQRCSPKAVETRLYRASKVLRAALMAYFSSPATDDASAEKADQTRRDHAHSDAG